MYVICLWTLLQRKREYVTVCCVSPHCYPNTKSTPVTCRWRQRLVTLTLTRGSQRGVTGCSTTPTCRERGSRSASSTSPWSRWLAATTNRSALSTRSLRLSAHHKWSPIISTVSHPPSVLASVIYPLSVLSFVHATCDSSCIARTYLCAHVTAQCFACSIIALNKPVFLGGSNPKIPVHVFE